MIIQESYIKAHFVILDRYLILKQTLALFVMQIV